MTKGKNMINIPDLHGLKLTLATMKSARAKSVNMNIWTTDIEAVEGALVALEALRALHAPPVEQAKTEVEG